LNEFKVLIAHLSDLHFCDVFRNTADQLSSVIDSAPHNYNLLIDLDTTFHQIPEKIKKRFELNSEHKINLLVMTGDLTTTANPISFEEANNFLRWSKYIGQDGPNIGLKMLSDVLVVPGNHDTWFTRLKKWFYIFNEIQDRSDAYERYFPRCPYIKEKQYGGTKFLFIGLNSNKTARKLKNISKGKINDTDLTEITNKLSKNKEDNIFRIALVHHHPWLPPNIKESEFTKLEESEDILHRLSNMEIDMVLFGHKHISFEDTWEPPQGFGRSKLLLSCAGSASQMGRQPVANNFKVYLFFKNEIVIINYYHDGFRFAPTRPKTFSYPNGSPFN